MTKKNLMNVGLTVRKPTKEKKKQKKYIPNLVIYFQLTEKRELHSTNRLAYCNFVLPSIHLLIERRVKHQVTT